MVVNVALGAWECDIGPCVRSLECDIIPCISSLGMLCWTLHQDPWTVI
jgi:hypothetical protein